MRDQESYTVWYWTLIGVLVLLILFFDRFTAFFA